MILVPLDITLKIESLWKEVIGTFYTLSMYIFAMNFQHY